jgi:hypothetical protein
VVEVYLRSALGPVGWDLLQFLLAHRLLICSAIVGGYAAWRIFRWARSRTNPDLAGGGKRP